MNAGGVTVSYFEWAQNIQRVPWDLKRVNFALEDILVRAYCAVEERANVENITFRESAFAIAVERVVRAVELQGLP